MIRSIERRLGRLEEQTQQQREQQGGGVPGVLIVDRDKMDEAISEHRQRGRGSGCVIVVLPKKDE